jgi:hypothetical protein
VLTFALLALGREDVSVPRNKDAHVMDSTEAMSEDDKMLLNCLEHVSCTKVYFLIDQLFAMLTFVFVHALALSKTKLRELQRLLSSGASQSWRRPMPSCEWSLTKLVQKFRRLRAARMF